MLSQQASAKATEKLISVLEGTLAELMIHAKPEHQFRFVSAAQHGPITTALALWYKNGKVGPQPMASIAEMRGSFYDQAMPASKLRAFPKVASVAGIELAETTLAGLKARHIIAARPLFGRDQPRMKHY